MRPRSFEGATSPENSVTSAERAPTPSPAMRRPACQHETVNGQTTRERKGRRTRSCQISVIDEVWIAAPTVKMDAHITTDHLRPILSAKKDWTRLREARNEGQHDLRRQEAATGEEAKTYAPIKVPMARNETINDSLSLPSSYVPSSSWCPKRIAKSCMASAPLMHPES